MRSFDAIIIGAGIIGMSAARELRKGGLSVLVVEKSEPAREASWAGAGMLVANPVEQKPPLREISAASAALYPDFVREVEEESGIKVDFRREGALVYSDWVEPLPFSTLTIQQLEELEPAATVGKAWLVQEDSVDPRTLNAALYGSCRKLDVHFATGSEVLEVKVERSCATGVATMRTSYSCQVAINAAGAWGGQVKNAEFPVRPVKGHMLSLLSQRTNLLRHVLRSRDSDIYLVPRTNGPIAVGATVEEVGFDKRIEPETINRLHQSAALFVPELGEARIHESWVGLRPASPDGLPLVGEMSTAGVYAANGHFRNGILLAPITAKILAALICNQPQPLDISTFSPQRFPAHA